MNMENRKRVSQKTIQEVYLKGGAAAVRVLLTKFPGGKLTFRKTIESMKALGKDCSDLDALDGELFGSAKTFLTTFDAAVLGTPKQIAEENGIDQNQVYIISREREIEPESYLREEGARGKGTALYNREEMKVEIAAFFAAKRNEFRETFDNMTEVTTGGVACLLEACTGLDAPFAAPFLKLFNIPVIGKFREAGAKGKGTNLFSRATVQEKLRIILANREAGPVTSDEEVPEGAQTDADVDAESSEASEVPQEATQDGQDTIDVSLLQTNEGEPVEAQEAEAAPVPPEQDLSEAQDTESGLLVAA